MVVIGLLMVVLWWEIMRILLNVDVVIWLILLFWLDFIKRYSLL